MQFLYCDNGGEKVVILKNEIYKYLFKVRRHKPENPIYIRNPEQPEILYKYEVISIDRRKAKISLISQQEQFIQPKKDISLGWCVVDNKVIEKTLPMINELGVQEIIFVYCDFSQQDIKLDLSRFERILRSSSMQSGRYDIPIIKIKKSVNEFLEEQPQTVVIDFSEEKLEKMAENSVSILVGAEGGFSENERKEFKIIKGLQSPYILRSQTAVISAISTIG